MSFQRWVGYEGYGVLAKDFDSFLVGDGTYLEDFSRGGRESDSSFSNLTGGSGEQVEDWRESGDRRPG